MRILENHKYDKARRLWFTYLIIWLIVFPILYSYASPPTIATFYVGIIGGLIISRKPKYSDFLLQVPKEKISSIYGHEVP